MPVTLAGEGRLVEPGGSPVHADPGTARSGADGSGGAAPTSAPPSALRIVLDADLFAFDLGGQYHHAAYRDLATVAVQAGTVLLVLGRAPWAPRLLCESFGEQLGLLVTELRDRRLRQRLADRFIELPADKAIELVEYEATTGKQGVAHLAYHDHGFVLAPLDERQRWQSVPRGRIGRVDLLPDVGGLQVDILDGLPVRLLRLGSSAVRHGQAMTALRDAALADAAALVEALIADAPFETRDRAAALLVDGRPADVDTLGPAWAPLEAAVLAEPTFAESYRALVAKAGGAACAGGSRWRPSNPARRS